LKTKRTHPPKLPLKFFRWYCHPKLVDHIEGDLVEVYGERLKTIGKRKACIKFLIDVLLLFRPGIIRPPEGYKSLNKYGMIKSYIKTSGRNIVRHKMFSTINIVGLAISMSVGLLMIAFILDLLSYDDFHEKKERIYRVITVDQQLNQPAMNFASTTIKAGKRIKESIPGIEQLTILHNNFSGDAIIGANKIPVGGLWADNSFFNVFTFPFIKGDPATALKEPYSVVVTESTSRKLFGDDDALGKSIKFDTTEFIVSGVIKDIPKFSHLRFELLISLPTLEIQKPTSPDGALTDWTNIYNGYVYLVIPENADVKTLQANLDQISKAENTALQNRTITLSLQKLKDIALGRHLVNQIGPTMIVTVLWMLCGLALVVILSAGFNYTNLSIARALGRTREVGIRKVIGASKNNVRGQFIIEAILISLSALVVSFLLFLFIKEQLFRMIPQLSNFISFDLSWKLIVSFIGFAILVGAGAGLLPALFFSRINAIQVLKNATPMKMFRHVTMRKILIVSQYSLSLLFMTSTVIGYFQYKSFLTMDLGFSTENILNVRQQGNAGDLLSKEFAEIPGVNQISRSLIITSIGNLYGTQMKYLPNDSSGVFVNIVNENYLPLHHHKLIAGKNFATKQAKAEENEVIVNEQVLKRFDIAKGDPAKAIGEVVTMEGKKLTIIGVLKDFHYGTVENKIEPTVLRYSHDPGGYLNLKISSRNLQEARAQIENAWKKIDPVHPIEAKFYNEQLEAAYAQFSIIIKVIGFLSILAIAIASMGLFGMVVFTTETKLREISIRKVLGASEKRLVYLLSKGFLSLLLIAGLIALPVAYFLFNNIILVSFTYHQPIGIVELSISAGIVILIAVLMIGSQTLKAARSNPADILKTE